MPAAQQLPRLLAVVRSYGLLLFCLLFWLSGCSSSGQCARFVLSQPCPVGRDIVEDIELVGVDSVNSGDVREGLATQESPRFLGLIDGLVFDYETFDENTLAKDLERVERYYRAQGFYEARVTAARVVPSDKGRVRIEIQVHEGPRVMVRNSNVVGLSGVPLPIASEAVKANQVDVGEPLLESVFENSKLSIANSLADNGYAFVEVFGRAQVDLAHHAADVIYEVKSGRPTKFGKITILGLQELDEGPIRDALLIEEGETYSRAELEDAQQTLFNLGVFASVEIEPDLSSPDKEFVPIKVAVVEAPLRTVKLGGGARFDVLRLAAHLRAGWEHKNFFGGLRHFTIDARPGATFYPTRIDALRAPTKVLPESNVRVALRQPAFFEGRTTGRLEAQYNVYPLLYPLPEDADPNLEPIIGYNEVIATAGVDRMFFHQHFLVDVSYNWQANFPFDYQGDNSDLLESIRVSFPELITQLDFRNDPIAATDGVMLRNSLQVAGFAFGGTVSDVRVQPELRTYTRLRFLPGSWLRRFVLATRVTMGFLFPSDYGPTDERRATAEADPTDPSVIAEQQKLLFRGFFSGGPNSNRGYGFRQVGPQGPIGFLIPTGVNCSFFVPDPGMPGSSIRRDVADLPDTCIRPLGGYTLWEASIELRFPLLGALNGTFFADASDVSSSVGNVNLRAPHLSLGGGLRYATPVGPLRLDAGWPIPGLQVLADDDSELDISETENEGSIIPTIHLAIGEAF